MWLKLGATAVAAIVVAEGAAWVLRPREVIEPVAVAEPAYFPAAQVARAVEYRDGQRALMIGGMALQGAVLVLLATGRPPAARRALERAGERPVLGGAAAGAGIALALGIAALPADVWAHERAVDVGISTQDLAGWASDWLKSAGIGAVIAGGAAAAALALVRSGPRRWPGNSRRCGSRCWRRTNWSGWGWARCWR